jgi:hypothetical protein
MAPAPARHAPTPLDPVVLTMASLREQLDELAVVWEAVAGTAPRDDYKTAVHACWRQLTDVLNAHPEGTHASDEPLKPAIVSLTGDEHRCWVLGSDDSIHRWHRSYGWERIPGPFDGDAS